MSLDPDALARLSARVGFRMRDGRLVETNEPDPSPAPRLLISRTRVGAVCFARFDVDDSVAGMLEDVAGKLAPLPESLGERTVYEPIRHAAQPHFPITQERFGLAYHFAAPPLRPHPDVVRLFEGDSSFVGPFDSFVGHVDAWEPFFAVVRGEAIVSACFSARITSEANEAGVNTNVEYRGRGLAAACTNAWRLAIEATGRIPLYSTSYDNRSSQAVTRRLGLNQYAETFALF